MKSSKLKGKLRKFLLDDFNEDATNLNSWPSQRSGKCKKEQKVAQVIKVTLLTCVFILVFGAVTFIGFSRRESGRASGSLLKFFNGSVEFSKGYSQEEGGLLSQPRQRVVDEVTECNKLHELNESEHCDFVQWTADCFFDQGQFNYTFFIYCGEIPYSASISILAVWLVTLFVTLGLTADDFFCPALAVISDTLKLSQNVAGVTFLAFGNGAPDIFAAIAAIGGATGGDAGLAIGAIFGAGIFVTTVVAGMVGFLNPFEMMQRPFLRDIIFYMGAVYWTFTIMWKKEITLYDSVGFLSMYIVYVLVVVIGKSVQTILSEDPDEKKARMVRHTSIVSTLTEESSLDETPVGMYLPRGSIMVDPSHLPKVTDARSSRAVKDLARLAETVTVGATMLRDIPDNPGLLATASVASMSDLDPKETGLTKSETMETNLDDDDVFYEVRPPKIEPVLPDRSRNGSVRFDTEAIERNVNSIDYDPDLDDMTVVKRGAGAVLKDWLGELWGGINPIDMEEFREEKIHLKIYDIVKAPILFMLLLTVPVVSGDTDKNNWNKPLNMLHFMTGPFFTISFLTQGSIAWFVEDADGNKIVPTALVVVAGGLLVSIVVGLTSTRDKPPVYHVAFAYMGFVVSVVWIYASANGVVNLLKTFGIVFNISDSILGLTFLAWGNSLGDFLANTLMARQGFPRMAISACFGGPLFNLLLGIGIPFTVITLRDGAYPIIEARINYILTGALAVSLISSFLVIPFRQFKMDKFNGIYLSFIYVAFVALAILTEVNIL